MDHLLTVPHERLLLERAGRGRTSWQLAGERRTVGTYDGRELVKNVKASIHTYRKRPGVAWNLELLALAERFRPQPKALVIRLDSGTVLRVPFRTALRYAAAAQAGDGRYLLRDDKDAQVLIPWEVWNGSESAPAPLQMGLPL